jgi:alpha-amylase
MIFHCHQPVFNTDKEIERAYKKAYFPLIETLKKFPGIKSCFHFSGNLLEWLEQRHPEYIQGLNDLISAKQIELLSGGYSEPIMPVISEKDRLDQIRLHKNIIKRLFNISADGMWVTERVWDPCLVNTLSRADLKYAVIDEDHFTRSGFSEELAYKPCRVKKGEESVILLHGHSFLRYSIPFKESKKTLDYFKRIVDSIGLNDVCFLFADDAEKFGAWPYTYKHVYKNGWSESFLEGLEINNDWIETSTCSGIIEKISAEDIKCPENSSYKEMRI